MFKYYQYFFLILFSLLIACEENIDSHLTGKNLPVVYGIYNLNFRKEPFNGYYMENPNYISLSRTFQGGQNAYASAKIADSLYYKNADVKIEYCFQGHIVGTTTLEKTTDFQKVPGLFSTSGNIIYQTTKHYVPKFFDTLRLIINTGNEGEVYTSETQYISGPKIISPLFHPSNPMKIGLYRSKPFYFEWLDYGGYFEINMLIKYLELKNNKITEKNLSLKKHKLSHKEMEENYCDWAVFFNNIFDVFPSQKFELSYLKLYFSGNDLAFFLRSSISEDPDVIARKIKSIDFTITATSKTFYDFIHFGNHIQDNGNIYSNINNGIGIFTSACTDSVTGLTLDYQTEDSIANGQYTKHLKFVTYNIGVE